MTGPDGERLISEFDIVLPGLGVVVDPREIGMLSSGARNERCGVLVYRRRLSEPPLFVEAGPGPLNAIVMQSRLRAMIDDALERRHRFEKERAEAAFQVEARSSASL